MNEQTELLREMRDLLVLIAEPHLAKRDETRRSALSTIVGRSKGRAKAVQLMDGTRNQGTIIKETKIDAGDMSRLVKALRTAGLIVESEKELKLVLSIPQNFFETEGKK